ncbi:Outer membrane protein [hydrothermal vent metagenome]|uniref:Outer membrane protein n=1 Tax=hydrothermal vent metagenome TaxID=652676 RepID=A0A1W1D3S4_9ZZZZ
MVKKILLSSALCYCSLQAQTLMLRDAVNEIVHTNPEIQEKLHTFKANIESYKYAKTGFLPKVDVDLSLGSETTKSKTTHDESKTLFKTESSLKLVENLFSGYETTNDIKQQKEKYISASLSIIEKANEIALSVAQTYINILKAKQLLLLEQDTVETHKDILNQIQAKVDAGFSPVSDSLQVQTRYTLAQADLQTQKNELENELAKFHKLLGRFPHINDFQDPIDDFNVPSNLNQAIMFALKNNPAIKIANHNVLAQKYAYKKAEKTKWPTIDLVVQGHFSDNANGLEDSSTQLYAGISMQYNIYNGGADEIDTQRNISLIHEENTKRDQVRRDVIESVILAYKTYNILHKKDKILKQHLDFAKKTNTAYHEEFKIGNRTLLDVLNMEVELNDARKKSVTNKYDMLVAKLRLEKALGTLANILNVSVDDITNLKYSDKNPKYKKDTLPLNLETDHDKILDMQDICDKSQNILNVNKFGCKNHSEDSGIEDLLKQAPLIQEKKKKSTTSITDDIMEELPDVSPSTPPKPKKTYPMQQDEKLFENNTQPPIQNKADDAPKLLHNKEYIYFEYGSSKLTNNSKRLVDMIIAKLKHDKNLKLKLTGYTDNLGPKRRNEIRSKSRADTVKRYLIAHGIDGRRISVFGMGESNPIASNATPEGRSLNRRVEFKFIDENGIQQDYISEKEKNYQPKTTQTKSYHQQKKTEDDESDIFLDAPPAQQTKPKVNPYKSKKYPIPQQKTSTEIDPEMIEVDF